MKRIYESVCDECAMLWCHRVAYAGLMVVYLAACLGLADKEAVNQCGMVLYWALSVQRH